MNALLDDLDLGNVDADQLEREIALHGALPAGKYHARLVEAADRQAGSFEIVTLKFEVLAPPYAGKVVPADVFISGPFETEDKEKKARANRTRFLHQLGILQKTQANGKNTYLPVPGKTSFRDVLGAQCVIDVIVEERQGKGEYAGRTFKENKILMFGVFSLNDPEVKNVPRANGVAPPLPAASKPVNLDGI